MNSQEWTQLVEQKREEIIETLKEALKLAFENGNFCNVILDTDGKTHIFEDDGREIIYGEHFYIKGFDSQHSSVVDAYFDDRDIYLECLENELTEKQRAEYEQAIEEYFEENEDDMPESDREEWIGTHAPNAVDTVYDYAWNELCSDVDWDEIIDDAISEYLDFEKEQKKEKKLEIYLRHKID